MRKNFLGIMFAIGGGCLALVTIVVRMPLAPAGAQAPSPLPTPMGTGVMATPMPAFTVPARQSVVRTSYSGGRLTYENRSAYAVTVLGQTLTGPPWSMIRVLEATGPHPFPCGGRPGDEFRGNTVECAVGLAPGDYRLVFTVLPPTPEQSVCRFDPTVRADSPPGSTPVIAEIVVDRSRHSVYEGPAFRVALTNPSSEPVELRTRTAGRLFDVTVSDAAGRPVWRSSSGQSVLTRERGGWVLEWLGSGEETGVGGVCILGPGETLITERVSAGVRVSEPAPGRHIASVEAVGAAVPATAQIIVGGPSVRIEIPGSATLPPFGTVVVADPPRTRPSPQPGFTPPSGPPPRQVQILSDSEQEVTVHARVDTSLGAGTDVTVEAPAGFAVHVVQVSDAALCTTPIDRPALHRCTPLSNFGRLTFTTSRAPAVVEAFLDLRELRPCVPEAGRSACDRTREALWNGDAAAWAVRGVTAEDARFVETVLFRIRAGDPVAIAGVARATGRPYLKITRLRFAPVEEVEVTNLGGAPQDVTGWLVRSVDYDRSVALPAGYVLRPGERCTIRVGPALVDRGGVCRETTASTRNPPPGWWPDHGGRAQLVAGHTGPIADDTRYSADPFDQPPPPNLQAKVEG